MTLLDVVGLRKSYGAVDVVCGLDLQIRRGECYGLLGPNGAGKTSTLRLCLGQIAPDAGEITLLGEPIPRRAREARQRLGVVPQSDSLDPDFSVAENLLVYGRYFGLLNADIQRRIPALLEFAGLSTRGEARIQSLSGGMKRRLSIARSLINDPDLLILDEPTTGLDPQARHLIWDRMKLLLSQGKTILLTTHFMDEAERLCHRLSIMDGGRLIASGSPRELIAQHIEPEVVEVFGEGVHDWADQFGSRANRCERAGETVFCYTDDASILIASIQKRASLHYMRRQANLEDVFLKLTGRDLRE